MLDYNENSTAQYMYKQAVIHTKLSNRLYPHSQHDTARQYRTCIMDSDMVHVYMYVQSTRGSSFFFRKVCCVVFVVLCRRIE